MHGPCAHDQHASPLPVCGALVHPDVTLIRIDAQRHTEDLAEALYCIVYTPAKRRHKQIKDVPPADETCDICYERSLDGEAIRLGCGHRMCGPCYERGFLCAVDPHTRCPFCRVPIASAFRLPVFYNESLPKTSVNGVEGSVPSACKRPCRVWTERDPLQRLGTEWDPHQVYVYVP